MLLGRKIMVGILAAGMVSSASAVTLFALNDKGIIKLHEDELREYNAQFYSEGSLVYETGKIKKGTAIGYGYGALPTKKRTPDGKIYQCIGWDITGEGIPDVVPTKIYGDFKANAVFIRLPTIEKLLMDPDLIAKLADLLTKLNVELTPEQVQNIMNWLMDLGIDWTSIDMSVLEQIFNLLNIDLQQFLNMTGLDLAGLMSLLSIPMFRYTASSAGAYYFRTQSFGNSYKDNTWTSADYYASSRISAGSVNPLAFSTDKIASANMISTSSFEMTYLNQGDYYPVPCNEVNNTQNVDSDSYSLTSPTEIQPVEGAKFSARYNTNAYGFVPACTYSVNLLRLIDFSNPAIAKDEQAYRQYARDHYLEVSDTHRALFTRIANENGISNDLTYNYLSQILKFFSGYKFDYMMQAYPSGVDKISYFIETAKAGIGTHFADASTMFFRTLGIPARTVSGYVDIAEYAMEEREVSGIQSHSWTEIYLDGIGWMTFDACLADDAIPPEYSQYLMNSFETIDPEFGSEKIVDLDVEIDSTKEYFVGDSFSNDDLTFRITTENGEVKEIPYSEMTFVSTPDMYTPGEQTITGIIVQDTEVLTASTTINVKPIVPVSLSLDEWSINTEVFIGDLYNPNPSGTVTMNNGSVHNLYEFGGAAYAPIDTSHIGTQTVSFYVPGYPDVYQNVDINVIGPIAIDVIESEDVASTPVGSYYDPYAVANVTLSNGQIISSDYIGGLDHSYVDTSSISTQQCTFSLSNFSYITDVIDVEVYGPIALEITETVENTNCFIGTEYNPEVYGEIIFSNGDHYAVGPGDLVHTPIDTSTIGIKETTFSIPAFPGLTDTVEVEVYAPASLEILTDSFDTFGYVGHEYGASPEGIVHMSNGFEALLSDFGTVSHNTIDTSTSGVKDMTFTLDGYPGISDTVPITIYAPKKLNILEQKPAYLIQNSPTALFPWASITYENNVELSYYGDLNYVAPDVSTIGPVSVEFSLPDYPDIKTSFEYEVVGPVSISINTESMKTKYLVGDSIPSVFYPSGTATLSNGQQTSLYNLNYGGLTTTEHFTDTAGVKEVTLSLVNYPGITTKVEMTVLVSPDSPIKYVYLGAGAKTNFEIPPNGEINYEDLHMYAVYEDNLSRPVDSTTGTFTVGADLSHVGDYKDVPVTYTEPQGGQGTVYVNISVRSRSAIYVGSYAYVYDDYEMYVNQNVEKEYNGAPFDLNNIFLLDFNVIDMEYDPQYMYVTSILPVDSAAAASAFTGDSFDVLYTFEIYNYNGQNITHEYLDTEGCVFYINGEAQEFGNRYIAGSGNNSITFIATFRITQRVLTIYTNSIDASSQSDVDYARSWYDPNYYCDNLLDGHYIDYSSISWITPSGSVSQYENTFNTNSIVIRDGGGNDVTKYYTINLVPGTVTISS